MSVCDVSRSGKQRLPAAAGITISSTATRRQTGLQFLPEVISSVQPVIHWVGKDLGFHLQI